MMFPITLKNVEKMADVMKKLPDTDFVLEVKVEKGVLIGFDLVYRKHSVELDRYVSVHVPIDA